MSHPRRMPRSPTREATNHLRAWREFRGLSQEDLAAKAGTAGNVISLLESGDRGLSPKWLRLLAPILGTEPGILLDHNPNDLDTDIVREAMKVGPARRAEAVQLLRILAGGAK